MLRLAFTEVPAKVSPRAARTSAPSTRNGRTHSPKKATKRADANTQEQLHFFRMMLLLRRFEEKTAEMYQRARIGGYCHLNLGEEATCVGLCAGMQPNDYLFTNYREHGYAIAGGQLPLATGAALAIVRQEQPDVVVCQMGDATTNIGAFHESLNIAALWKLPVVYVIINNGFGMGTSVSAGSSVPELWKKACAYGMPGVEVDGNDVVTVRDATREAVERARTDHTPSLLDIKSFRLKGHSVVDPDRYRTSDYLQQIRSQDPLARMAQSITQRGILDEDGMAQLEEEIDREVAAAVEL